ncbi:hypothetical protein GGS20DRAFT_130156 [Poronia punctata]|nr:hypothetical protein GGS20DRAFT_130156 [Poronia punctata]
MVTPAPEPPAQPTRRKIRKGTRSCWECKRRKYKCTWPRSAVDCDGCRSRGTPCISQEFPDHQRLRDRHRRSSSSSNNNREEDKDSRLERVEALLEELTRKVEVNSGDARARLDVLRKNGDEILDDDNTSLWVSRSSSSTTSSIDTLRPSVPRGVVGSNLGQFGQVTGRITPLTHALITAWPSKDHQEAILNTTLANVGSLHPAMSASCSGCRTPPSPKDMLQLPSPGSSPLAIARKLMLLSTYLQVVSSHPELDSVGQGPNYRDMMNHAFETVNKLVTHNDDLPASIEIVECLITESQYHNYTGDVRRAWITMSRALAMAQILGLDRQSQIPRYDLGTDEEEDQMSSRRESVWFLLVHFGQYLSIMLGISAPLPEYSQTDAGFGLFGGRQFTRSERMVRLHSIAAGRILGRNRIDMHDVVETRNIDNILDMAAACMPARWWLPPGTTSEGPDDESFSQVDRLMTHFAHYNLLLQLHLPCMLRSLTGSQRTCYSTTAVINASRELLTRFTAYRSRYPTVSYCRGLDFFTFVASTALCLLHIQGSHYPDSGNDMANLVAHQRPTHRGLMEEALERIQQMAHVRSTNNIISDMIPAFQRLLSIEDEASRGGKFDVCLLNSSDHLQIGTRDVSNDDSLEINLPFCGTIRIVHSHPNAEEPVHEPFDKIPSPVDHGFGHHALASSIPISTMVGPLDVAFPPISPMDREVVDSFSGVSGSVMDSIDPGFLESLLVMQ